MTKAVKEQSLREWLLSPERALDINFEILGRELASELGNKHPEIAYKIGQIQKKTAEEQNALALNEINRRLDKIEKPVKTPNEYDYLYQQGFNQAIQAMKEMLK